MPRPSEQPRISENPHDRDELALPYGQAPFGGDRRAADDGYAARPASVRAENFNTTTMQLVRPPTAVAEEPPPPRRFAAVDGLRGLAVLAVLVYDSGLFEGARFGIRILFVTAGFLTTLPVLRSMERDGRPGVGGLLWRRVKRFLPPVTVALAATLAVGCLLGSPSTARALFWQVPAALFQFTDIPQLTHHLLPTGFADAAAPLALMWPVSVTAQFSLVWIPFLGLVCFVLRGRLAAVIGVVVLAFAASALWPRVLPSLSPGAAVQTACVALLAGATVACAVHLGSRAVARRASGDQAGGSAAPTVLLTAAGALMLAGLVAGTVILPLHHREHAGAISTAATICVALLTGTLCTDRGPLVRLLSGKLISEVGQMSASAYLLHMPVFWLLRRAQPDIDGYAVLLLGGALTWFLSMLVHYLLIERLGSSARRPWAAVLITGAVCTVITAGAHFAPALVAVR